MRLLGEKRVSGYWRKSFTVAKFNVRLCPDSAALSTAAETHQHSDNHVISLQFLIYVLLIMAYYF